MSKLTDKQILDAMSGALKVPPKYAGWVRDQRIAHGRAIIAADRALRPADALLAGKDAEIAALTSHLADAQELIQKMMVKPDGWLHVNDELPPDHENVLVVNQAGVTTGSHSKAFGWMWDEIDDEPENVYLSHWMPLPTAPPKPSPNC